MSKRSTISVASKTPNVVTNCDHIIASRIRTVRGVQVMLDRDIAELYGVETRVLNQDVKRNIERFPEDFMFQLDKEECLRSQIVILKEKPGKHLKYMPYAVTKGGVASVAVHPREVFCEAIRWRAHAVIVAHNHPSGDPAPSERDIRITEELLAVAKVVRIHILDHLVIAGKGYTSIRANSELSFA